MFGDEEKVISKVGEDESVSVPSSVVVVEDKLVRELSRSLGGGRNSYASSSGGGSIKGANMT